VSAAAAGIDQNVTILTIESRLVQICTHVALIGNRTDLQAYIATGGLANAI